ncbi:hypothetical protein [Thermonema rossianum]|uniref:hypothetical protein n=1 Tax=Thermonema rossianum TaxID=55505 RepID=UPI00146F99FD|nr:hypothetical protein [Thermonema rossianum]
MDSILFTKKNFLLPWVTFFNQGNKGVHLGSLLNLKILITMKKLFLMLLAAGTFALVSCGEGQQENAETQEQPAAEDVQPAEEQPAVEEAQPETTEEAQPEATEEAPAEGEAQPEEAPAE